MRRPEDTLHGAPDDRHQQRNGQPDYHNGQQLGRIPVGMYKVQEKIAKPPGESEREISAANEADESEHFADKPSETATYYKITA